MHIIKQEHLLIKPGEFPYSVVQMKRLYGCDQGLIATKPLLPRFFDWMSGRDIRSQMVEVTMKAGFTLMEVKLIRFGVGEGVTVAQLLAESLQDMHTYPEVHGCAHVWLDYCCFNRDNTDLGERWWQLALELLKPTAVVDYPTIYVPVQPPSELGLAH